MKRSKFWKKKKVLVTGGASFIGSHLVDQLLVRGANVSVVDDLSSGNIGNIKEHIKKKAISFTKGDLRNTDFTKKILKRIDVVFHLAADHGGRGYVELHQAGPASNLYLDGLVFFESVKAGVEKVVFASSGCVYPNFLQGNSRKSLYLTEDLVKPPYDADNMYGWAKLMGELTLQAYHKEYGLRAASCRYFTVYGPRGIENHAVMAMIARAFIKQNPYEVWGDGTQIRNWTYVDDIVTGTILAGEKISDGSAINLGTMERIKVVDAVNKIFAYTDFHPRITFMRNMPTGPLNRVADNSFAKAKLGWEPKVSFDTGVRRTIDWYFSTKKKSVVAKMFEKKLTER